MINNPTTRRQSTGPQDIIETIHQFRLGELSLAATLDRLLSEIDLLPEEGDLNLGELEDRWTDIEIIYALAAEAGLKVLDGEDAAKIHTAMDEMVRLATRAL